MTLVSAFLSVSSRQLFRSAIYLLFSLIGVAGIYFWMDFQFIAAAQIIVYVGGIVVLIIFSVFLTQQSGEKLPKPNGRRILFSLLSTLFGVTLVLQMLLHYDFIGMRNNALYDAVSIPPSVSNIGEQLLSVEKYGYSLPFEAVSILLLSAMVGCIVIAMRKNKTI
ncbi:MAG: NADH-quinone oxidoreductase subunit J [Chitinophagaceae bacterium]